MLAEVTIALSPHRPVGATGARGAHRTAGTGGAAGRADPRPQRGCAGLLRTAGPPGSH